MYVQAKTTEINCTDSSIAIAPFAGISGKLRDLLLENDDGDVSKRLAAVEESTARIERMLVRLCEELDSSSGSGTPKGKDKSSIADLEYE